MPAGSRFRVTQALIALLSGFYLVLFWSRPAPWMPAWFRRIQQGIRDAAEVSLTALVKAFGGEGLRIGWRWAGISIVMGLVLPWLFMALIGRGHPRDLGIRSPNRVGWRLVVVGYLVSLPALFAMASSPATRAWYADQLKGRTVLALVGTYLVVLLAEHFMFQGLLLALLRRDRRWPAVPEPAPVQGSVWQRSLRFIGLAQPTSSEKGVERAMRWLGVPEGCLGAMVLSAALFGICHVGKAPAEVLLSFPGGLGLAYVAYRCNTVLVPLILHVATGLTALVLASAGA